MVPPVLVERFAEIFGHTPTFVAAAPGRVNLIGEHTDYNDGFVFPAAISLRLYVAASITNGPSHLASTEFDDTASFDTSIQQPGTVSGWAGYAAGVAWALGQQGFTNLPNVNALVMSEVPIGSGVSSSAALEMAFGALWNEIGGLGLTLSELARIGQLAENRYVGVNCGIMDQMASAMGRDNHAFFLDTRSLEIDFAPLPSNVRIVLCDTRASRALAESAYNERRSQCESAAAVLGVPALRDASLADLDRAGSQVSPLVYQRARHVITENDRCREFAVALREGALDRAGDLMRASHASLRVDYQVTGDALDAMSDAANRAPGVYGARMTGAGFGGACVALVRADDLDAFITATGTAFLAATGREGRFIVCRAVDGARAQPFRA